MHKVEDIFDLRLDEFGTDMLRHNTRFPTLIVFEHGIIYFSPLSLLPPSIQTDMRFSLLQESLESQ